MTELGPALGGYPSAVLEHVLRRAPFGHAVEFGVAAGRTLALIAAHMPVTGFDSFQGLPQDWRPGFRKGRFAGPIPHPPLNATLCVGLFADTLPQWHPPAPLGLVHLDADLYASTATALSYVAPFLQAGAYLVFDEFYGYPGCEQHEQKAFTEFIADTGYGYDVIGHGPEQWAIQLT